VPASEEAKISSETHIIYKSTQTRHDQLQSHVHLSRSMRLRVCPMHLDCGTDHRDICSCSQLIFLPDSGAGAIFVCRVAQARIPCIITTIMQLVCMSHAEYQYELT
jgi:hypothetical protein